MWLGPDLVLLVVVALAGGHSSDSTPSLGTFICHRCSCKKKKKKKTKPLTILTIVVLDSQFDNFYIPAISGSAAFSVGLFFFFLTFSIYLVIFFLKNGHGVWVKGTSV